jgi:hypothetical protein
LLLQHKKYCRQGRVIWVPSHLHLPLQPDQGCSITCITLPLYRSRRGPNRDRRGTDVSIGAQGISVTTTEQEDVEEDDTTFEAPLLIKPPALPGVSDAGATPAKGSSPRHTEHTAADHAPYWRAPDRGAVYPPAHHLHHVIHSGEGLRCQALDIRSSCNGPAPVRIDFEQAQCSSVFVPWECEISLC